MITLRQAIFKDQLSQIEALHIWTLIHTARREMLHALAIVWNA